MPVKLASKLSLLIAAFLAFSSVAFAQNDIIYTRETEHGASAIWIFANLSFTGMHAQGKGGIVWRVIAFIFGFPGTLLTLLVVRKGSERAYGIDMPRKTL